MRTFDNGADFVAALVETGKFTRNDKSAVLFQLAPDDYITVGSRGAFNALLKDFGIDFRIDRIQLACNPNAAWDWLIAYRHRFPRTRAQQAGVHAK